MSKRLSGLLRSGYESVLSKCSAVLPALAICATLAVVSVASADPAPITVSEQVALGAGVTTMAGILATLIATVVGFALGFFLVRAGIRWIRGFVK